ncbi:hypothetical protein ciss_20920 [Carboxydothermus islandicus]|uniref:Flagellar assembly protein FliH/Type III secretion system HrpE domain-containing protein n=1 Tax=Carboxydothermus islandicus TaxID=661089 RepID=A0A1L8D4Q5_9THEO|nr:hypothetical protein [Carboxydothermus islandicus]GAV26159.1 hypothetical protein ciss_20920 [Carboxydothermus islandicus]
MPWSFKSKLLEGVAVRPDGEAQKIPVKKIVILPEDVEKNYDESSALLNDAKIKAQEIIDAARREAEIIREDAKAKGYQQGYTEGQAKARQEFEKLQAALKKEYEKRIEEKILEINREREKIIKGLEQEIIAFIETSLEKLLGELPEAVILFYRKWLVSALAKFSQKMVPVIQVSPTDREKIEELLQQQGLEEKIPVISDTDLPAGTVVVKGEENYVISLKIFVDEILEKLKAGVYGDE